MNKTLPCLTLAMVFLSIGLAGCASLPSVDRTESSDIDTTVTEPVFFSSNHRFRVALDLVNTLQQVDGYAPTDGKLDISRLEGPFGDSLKRVLAARGYQSSTLPVEADTVVDVQMRRSRLVNQATVILTAGPIKIKRDYQLVNGTVKPASYLFIQGAPADNIEPDDSIFRSSSSLVRYAFTADNQSS